MRTILRKIRYSNELGRLTLSQIESFFVVAVAGQMSAIISTGFRFKACLEQAISRLQATPLSKKFEISMVEGILRGEFQNHRYGCPHDRSSYSIQTLQDGYDLHARHVTFDVIADTQSHIHTTFVCTDTKLVDVVIFFPLVSIVVWCAISPDGSITRKRMKVPRSTRGLEVRRAELPTRHSHTSRGT